MSGVAEAVTAAAAIAARGAAPPMLNHHHSWPVLNHSHSVYMSTFILLQLYTFILLTLHPLYNTLHHIIITSSLYIIPSLCNIVMLVIAP